MPSSAPIHSTCLNCGAALTGRFCAQCGQRDEDRHLPLTQVLGEVIKDIANYDRRSLVSLGLLLARPGQLTLEYLAGRRTRFLPPFRLYIFVSFLLFLALGGSASHLKTATRSAGPGQTQIQVHLSAEGEPDQAVGSPDRLAGPGIPAKPAGSARESALKRGIEAAVKNPDAFVTRLLIWVSRAMFLLLPAFAGLLKLLYLRSRRLFTEHFVFSLHFHAFVFLLFLVQWGLGHLPGAWPGRLAILLLLALPVHLGLALHRVYGQGLAKLLIKGALLSGAYLVLGAAMLLGVLSWTVYHP